MMSSSTSLEQTREETKIMLCVRKKEICQTNARSKVQEKEGKRKGRLQNRVWVGRTAEEEKNSR